MNTTIKSEDWITDRLPTGEDINEVGLVMIPDLRTEGWRLKRPEVITLGDPWLPSLKAEPYVAPKTPEQWFHETLPDWIAELAIANIDRDFEGYARHPESADQALYLSFNWRLSKEGQDFWHSTHDALEGRGDFPQNPAEKRYWSGPQDLPDGVIWMAQKNSPKHKRMFLDFNGDVFTCGRAYSVPWADTPDFRWSNSAKTPWEEMNECLVEGGSK